MKISMLFQSLYSLYVFINCFSRYDSTPTVLPTAWNGQFQLDPNDVRIKPERNASDVRDYADHRRFVTRE